MSSIEALVEKLTPRQRELLLELLAARSKSESKSESASEPEHGARAPREPIAVVGMGCRFPGGCDSPSELWDFLLEGGDAITEIPETRFSADAFYDPSSGTPGKMNTRWGGFLEDVESFDPQFFGISPREASAMDPQQRLVLEVAHETLDDAGIPAGSLAGSRTGVFVGTHSNDYAWIRFADPANVHSYLSTGTAHSIVANRLSFLLDVRGPSLSVDTACSSSLVGIHLACRSLEQRDCDLALAAGVNVILSPHWGVAVSQLGMLSPDGRCRAFDHRANGFVRSEGCGVVALKRLSDARAAGDRIYALVRGSCVNQDGRTNGLTAPNGLAQRAVVEAALEDAGVSPDEITYVETHGTGTTLGDPIEVEALAEALPARRTASPDCVLGSVKSNLGHLEAAAGVAGFIKAALALDNGRVPRQVHFEQLNPHIDLERTRFVIPTKTHAWPRASSPRRAGVSSFGFGGTNAHVVLEEAPRVARPRDEDAAGGTEPEDAKAKAHLLVLSARTREALQDTCQRYVSFLSSGTQEVEDVCATASRRRDRHAHRLTVVGADASEMGGRLESFLRDGAADGVAVGESSRGVVSALDFDGPVFVFSGQGPQWWAMGRELMQSEPVFRHVVARCDGALASQARWSLLEELAGSEESTRMQETEVAQSALFALQVGLGELLRSWGIQPSACIGHSVGELAAAHLAGALSLEHALRVVFERGRLMQAASAKGSMLSVELSSDALEERLGRLDAEISIAAMNAPLTTVVAGEAKVIEAFARSLSEEGIGARFLPVDYAFHSARMDPVRRELENALSDIAPERPKRPFFSTVTGANDGAPLDARYWGRNVREPVRFRAAVEAALDAGHRSFLEIGPHPVLSRSLWECLEHRSVEGAVLPSLRRGYPERRALLETLGALHVSGTGVRFDALYPGTRPPVSLPNYPFRRVRFPVDAPGPSVSAAVGPNRAQGTAHPLLGTRLAAAVPLYESRLSAVRCSLLDAHRFHGKVLFPAAGFIEMALASHDAPPPGHSVVIERLSIDRPLYLPDEGERERTVQWVGSTGESSAGETSFRVFSCETTRDGEWELHATGTVRRIREGASPERFDVDGAEESWERLSVDEHYERAARHGVAFGSGFRSVQAIYRASSGALARIAIGNPTATGTDLQAYRLHPALLDAGIQTLHALLGDDALYLPIGVDRFELRGVTGEVAFSHGSVRPDGSGGVVTCDVELLDATGNRVARYDGLRMKRVDARDEPLSLYAMRWRAQALVNDGASAEWLLIEDADGLARELEKRLRERGQVARALPLDELDSAIESDSASRLGVVHLASLEASPSEPLERAFRAIRATASKRPGRETRLWLVTRGAQPVGTLRSPLELAQAALWGLGATLALEHPELRPVLVDLDPARPTSEPLDVAGLLDWNGDETRVALRAGSTFVARLAPFELGTRSEACRLSVTEPGVLESLTFTEAARTHPGAGEVEIEVEATGLNFRDVLASLDMYPGSVGAPGSECSGRVSAVGPGASPFVVGERVVAALVPGSFASHVIAPVEHVVPLSERLSFAEGAATPIAFLTARYALSTCAQLRRGEWVLVHAGAGGVGMAAIQTARRLGAHVCATAGSPEKRELLRAMGVEHVADSRSLDFAARFREATGGEGVDVVLNSLSGAFIAESLGLLRRGGRFVEIGKRDVWSAERMASVREDVRYHVFDLEQVYRSEPRATRALLVEVMEALEGERLEPLPTRVFPAKDVAGAFRFMAEARHVGKIVVERAQTRAIDPEARYLVTGGLGALGLTVARWLGGKGARHVVLAGRNAPSPEATRSIEALRQEGVEVEIARCDVRSEEDVRTLVNRQPSLKGIVHAAGVLEDGLLLRQDYEAFTRPLAAKLEGALHLDRATRDLPRSLDFFVLFSSMASVVGSLGQAGYAAANAGLDALAHERRRDGRVASSVSWGPWSGKGMASRAEAGGRYRERGIRTFSENEAFAVLDATLSTETPPHVMALSVDWRRFVAELSGGATLYRDLVSEHRSESEPLEGGFVEELRRAPASKARDRIEARVRSRVLSVLGLAPDAGLDPYLGLTDAGLDSLMAVEVRNRLRGDFEGIALPTTLCFDFPTLHALTDFFMRSLGLDSKLRSVEPSAESSSVEREVRDLSEEEAEALLLQELDRRSGTG